MRNICALLALALVVGCGGGDGSDGAPGTQGAAGPPGANGQDGSNGEDGAPGTNGTNGSDGAPGTDGAAGGAILQGSGAPAAGTGADGDLYIDTVSRDVYQKANGAWTVITNLSGGPPGPKGNPGADGADGAPGTDGADGAPGTDGADGAPGTDGADGAPGADGADGVDGVDVKDTLGGVRWFAFGLSAVTFIDMPSLITSETYTDVSSAAVFTFTGAGQSGRLAFKTSGSFVSGGVDLEAFDAMNLSLTISGAAVTTLALYMAEGAKKGCQWNLNVAGGPNYVVDIDVTAASSCYNTSTGGAFSLASVTDIQVGIVSSAAGARTLTITDIDLVDSL